MSTVGYGDYSPTTPATRVATVILVFVGISIVFSQAVLLLNQFLDPLFHEARDKLEEWYPPATVEIRGIDGSINVLTVPMRPVRYYAENLSPAIAFWTALNLAFAGLLCAAQPISYGKSLYHMLITATTVGLGDIPIDPDDEHPWAKVVVIAHIYLTVGTLSAIISTAYDLMQSRQLQIQRIQLMMRKTDPDLLKQLHESHKAAQERSLKQRERKRARVRRATAGTSAKQGSRRNSCCDDSISCGDQEETEERSPQYQDVSVDEGMDKAQFVVGMLEQLGVLKWEEADPVMRHLCVHARAPLTCPHRARTPSYPIPYPPCSASGGLPTLLARVMCSNRSDQLDVRKCGRLYPAELVARQEMSIADQQKLHAMARIAGIKCAVARSPAPPRAGRSHRGVLAWPGRAVHRRRSSARKLSQPRATTSARHRRSLTRSDRTVRRSGSMTSRLAIPMRCADVVVGAGSDHIGVLSPRGANDRSALW